MINLTKEQIVKEVDKEMATGKHKYLWLAKDEVAKRFNINLMTLDNYYYDFKKREIFNVWIEKIEGSFFQVRARDESEAIIKARREWKKENKHPKIRSVNKLNIKEDKK